MNLYEKFAEKQAEKARVLLQRTRDLTRELAEAGRQLQIARMNCPHLRSKHHPMVDAQTKSWEECEDCGTTFTKEQLS